MIVYQIKRFLDNQKYNLKIRLPNEWQIIYVHSTSDKGLSSKIYKTLTNINKNTSNKPTRELKETLL